MDQQQFQQLTAGLAQQEADRRAVTTRREQLRDLIHQTMAHNVARNAVPWNAIRDHVETHVQPQASEDMALDDPATTPESNADINYRPLKRKRSHRGDDQPSTSVDNSVPFRSVRDRRLTERARLAAEQESDSEIEIDPIIQHFRKRKLAAPSDTIQKLARCEAISLVRQFSC